MAIEATSGPLEFRGWQCPILHGGESQRHNVHSPSCHLGSVCGHCLPCSKKETNICSYSTTTTARRAGPQ